MTNIGTRYDLLKRIEVLELQVQNYYDALYAILLGKPGFDPDGHHTVSSLILEIEDEMDWLEKTLAAR